MSIATNDRVYVAAPFRRGTGTVLSVRRDGVVRVCLDAGGTVRAAADHVRLIERRPAPVAKLTSAPVYETPGDPFSEAWIDRSKQQLRFPHYLAWLRKLPCAWCSKAGPSEASHHPEEGHGSTGLKATDLDTLPLCRECHGDWHQRTALGAMTSADTKAWCQVQIKRRNQCYMREQMGVGQ